MKRITCCVVLCCFVASTSSLAQSKPKNVKGEYSEMIPSHLSLQEAEKRFTGLARRNAIENTFGVGNVSTYDRRYIDWRTQNGSNQSEDRFFSETEVFTNARWIPNSGGKECATTIKDNKFYMTCKVWGKAILLLKVPITFKTYLLRCPQIECRTEILENGKPFYLFFRTPVKGYLTVFVQYQNTIQQLIPYPKMSQAILEIARDKDYIFFSSEKKTEELPQHLISEYIAYTEMPKSIEKLILVFSKQSHNKPPMETPEDQNAYGTYPPQTNAKDFGRWLLRETALQPDLQVEHLYYQIVKK